ncbi:MAG TPA: extracellular solute-binding protein [Xanthobacteraceae bacterium]|nr:extracellular solute-binding protein [Xanthobacteraceae bacterium]
MKNAIGALLFALLAPSLAHAQPVADWQKKWDETLKAARAEGKVVVTGPPDAQVRKLLPEAFKKRYGIAMEYQSARGSDSANKMRSERAAGIYTADAALAGSNTMFTVMLREKMLAPLRPELILPEVTEGKNWKRGSIWFVDPEEQYVLRLFSTVNEAFWVNTKEVKAGELRKIQDLLDPRWKGKIAFMDPTVAGTGANQAANLYAIFGADFVRKLFIDQQTTFSRERRQLTDWLARGTYHVAFGAEDGELQRLRQEGLPVDSVHGLEDMPGSLSGGNQVALYSNAPHPNAARVFVNWMASKEGSEIYARALNMVPVRTDIDASSFMPPEVIPKSGVNYFDPYLYEFTVTTKEQARRAIKEMLRSQ